MSRNLRFILSMVAGFAVAAILMHLLFQWSAVNSLLFAMVVSVASGASLYYGGYLQNRP